MSLVSGTLVVLVLIADTLHYCLAFFSHVFISLIVRSTTLVERQSPSSASAGHWIKPTTMIVRLVLYGPGRQMTAIQRIVTLMRYQVIRFMAALTPSCVLWWLLLSFSLSELFSYASHLNGRWTPGSQLTLSFNYDNIWERHHSSINTALYLVCIATLLGSITEKSVIRFAIKSAMDIESHFGLMSRTQHRWRLHRELDQRSK
jgi:hypothetical protein